jgi:pyridoxamine 5'-phosphate oxidase
VPPGEEPPGDGPAGPGAAFDLAGLRRDYDTPGLEAADLSPDPIAQFRRWLADAVDAGLPDANAMVVATVGADGTPAARTVLLKGVDDRGFVFYTNRTSRKGRDLAVNPRAALLFPWLALRRQVAVSGAVAPVADEESDAYFASRPRGSQLAAWASPQSATLPDRAALDRRVAEAAARFGDGPVPRPPFWGGYRVAPGEVELWQGRADRLHDRLRYRLAGDGWIVERLGP